MPTYKNFNIGVLGTGVGTGQRTKFDRIMMQKSDKRNTTDYIGPNMGNKNSKENYCSSCYNRPHRTLAFDDWTNNRSYNVNY